LLVTAIDEVGNRGEVKVTEWVRGGQLSWMKDVNVREEGSAYGLSPRRLSKQWWRAFIRQAAAAGYIKRTIKTAKFGQSTGVYASLSVTDVGRETVSKGDNVMLPKNSEQLTEASIAANETSNSSLNVSVSTSQGTNTKTREGK